MSEENKSSLHNMIFLVDQKSFKRSVTLKRNQGRFRVAFDYTKNVTKVSSRLRSVTQKRNQEWFTVTLGHAWYSNVRRLLNQVPGYT